MSPDLDFNWPFTTELSTPMWTTHDWVTRDAVPSEADLRLGWTVRDDSGPTLQSAWEDLDDFARAGGIPLNGPHVIETQIDPQLGAETHRVTVGDTRTHIVAGGPEGVRRAVFLLQRRMLAAGGPFLPLGTEEFTAVVRTRISRCMFGPINRPPANRDELVDEVDYYPPQYLNRLAHEGINGIWITVRLRDLYPQDWSGTPTVDPEIRLRKLRQTVAACARFGIKVHLFCIDPAAFGDGAEYLVPTAALESHPEFAGHRDARWTTFCTRSAAGRAYTVSALAHVFGSVPGLGGLITITIGERPTHCWSLPWSGTAVNCPRCTVGSPADAFTDHLRVLREGVSAGNPEADVTSWMYVPVVDDNPHWSSTDVQALLVDIAARTPPGVTVQMNMESTGTTEHFGRAFDVFDYSLAWVGPSDVFARVADAVAVSAGSMGAKLQVGCSHEVATVPYVPVPGNLYRKYAALHAHGVSSVMQSWYFGNAPGPMTAAAGRLSFAPLPATEDAFLDELARPMWGDDAETMAAAWRAFRDAYSRFPATLPFSWFGPVHDSCVWAWHLDPVDEPIAPSWELGWPASGDRVGECFAPAYGHEEIIELVDGIAAQWKRGVDALEPLRARPNLSRAQLLELGVAEALGLQFAASARVLRWYRLRERLARCDRSSRPSLLQEMADLVDAQLPEVERLMALSADDTRLGFHSEAEGYKYDPDALRLQHTRLRDLRDRGIPALRRRIDEPCPLWPGWSAPSEDEPVLSLAASAAVAASTAIGAGAFRVWSTDEHLTLEADLVGGQPDDELVIEIEAARLWPIVPFRVSRAGWATTERTVLPTSARWHGEARETDRGWSVHARWPIEMFHAPGMRDGFRLSVRWRDGEVRWPSRTTMTGRPRLCFGGSRPDSLGWAVASHGIPGETHPRTSGG